MKKIFILILITALTLFSCKNNTTDVNTSPDNNNSSNTGDNNGNNAVDNNNGNNGEDNNNGSIVIPEELEKYVIDINTATKENIEEAIKKYAKDHNGENKVIFKGTCNKIYDGMQYGTTIAGMIRYIKLNNVIVSLEYVEFKDKKLPDSIVGGSQNYNDNIVKIIIPNDITVIGKDAVTCSKLTNINIPSNLVSIEDGAFYACKFTTLNLPNSLKTIGYAAFRICHFENLVIPDSVTSIGAKAFQDTTISKTLKLSENLTVLEENVFSSCSTLKEVTIPASVKEIKKAAFYYSKGLETVIFLSSNPPTIGELAFSGTVLKTIYVPKGSQAQYEKLKGQYGIPSTVTIIEQ